MASKHAVSAGVPMPHPFYLVTGGCRSGKSAYAQALAEHLSPRGLFIATAGFSDADMQERIAEHRQQRGRGWRVYEAGVAPAGLYGLADALPELMRPEEVVLLDCLTLWASGCMQGEEAPPGFAALCEGLAGALRYAPCPVVVVTGEVGMGVAPPTRAGRNFRDMAGLAGQTIASVADTVVLVACGLPLLLKGNLPPAFAGGRNT